MVSPRKITSHSSHTVLPFKSGSRGAARVSETARRASGHSTSYRGSVGLLMAFPREFLIPHPSKAALDAGGFYDARELVGLARQKLAKALGCARDHRHAVVSETAGEFGKLQHAHHFRVELDDGFARCRRRR